MLSVFLHILLGTLNNKFNLEKSILISKYTLNENSHHSLNPLNCTGLYLG